MAVMFKYILEIWPHSSPAEIKERWRQIKNHKLISNAGLYVSGEILQKGVAFLLVPIWARFLTPHDYGIIGTLAAFSGVLLTLFVMGLHGAIVRYFYDYADNTSQQKNFITALVLFQMVLPSIALLALNIWGPLIWDTWIKANFPFDPYVRLMLWSTYIASLLQIPLALYRAQQKAISVVYAKYGQFCIAVISYFIFLVGLRWGAYGILLSQFIAAFILAVILIVLLMRTWFTWPVKWRHVQTGLFYGLPLVPHLLADWVMRLGDRIILTRMVSLSDIGLYSLGCTLGGIMGFVVSGINQAYSPYYFRLMTSDPHPGEKIIRIVTLYVATISGICLTAILFAGELIYIFLPERFYGSIPFVAPILLAHLMIGFYYFAVAPLHFYKKTKWIPVLTCAGAILNIVLNLLFIPHFGVIAAAWTTTASNSFLFLIFFMASRKYQKIKWPLMQYGLLVLVVTISTGTVNQLDIFHLKTLIAKFVLLMIYVSLAYFIVINNKRKANYHI